MEAATVVREWYSLSRRLFGSGYADLGSGNARDGVIQSDMLIGFPRSSPAVCFSTDSPLERDPHSQPDQPWKIRLAGDHPERTGRTDAGGGRRE